MKKLLLAVVGFFSITPVIAFADGWAPATKASNVGSIVNTRHNMTVSYSPDPGMEYWLTRGVYNNYGEVCVYCHTPHGANGTINAPLWNRTNPNNTYTLYNLPLQSGQTPTNPGVNSLTCLSCHDGVTAIDSIINMPGSGKYNATQETGMNIAFLDTWNGPHNHAALTTHNAIGLSGNGCFGCHSSAGLGTPEWLASFSFEAFVIGTDLTDDHPVGVQLPDTAVYDFNAPTATTASMKIYDTNGNGRADSNEVRFYNAGGGYEVECASCHDPHGVESAGPGSMFIPSFLRVNNNNASSLCLTCHVK